MHCIRGLAALAALPLILASPEARACAACGCGDPSVSEIGIPDAMGGVVGGVATEIRQDRIRGTTTRDERLTAMAFWSARPELRLYAKIPFVRREVGDRAGWSSRAASGDAELGGSLEVFHSGGLSRGMSLAVSARLLFPTAHSDESDLSPGMGAPAAGLGLNAFAHLRTWRGYASILEERVLERPDGSKPGDDFFANAGLEAPLTAKRIDWTAEINLRQVSPDHWPLGARVSDSGGFTAYATPGIFVSLDDASRWFARASVQLPIYWDVCGSQTPGPGFSAGLFTSF